MIKLEQLLFSDDETIAEYGLANSYQMYHCIIEKGSTDISAALEETLHRILENDGLESDIEEIMGAEIQYNMEDEEKESISIDCGYVLPCPILFFNELEQEEHLYQIQVELPIRAISKESAERIAEKFLDILPQIKS